MELNYPPIKALRPFVVIFLERLYVPETDFNFLRKFTHLFRDTEVPERFAVWAGISMLSAILERKVWLNSRVGTIYPNMYVVLIGESGRARKSTAIVRGRELLLRADIGIKILPQKTSPEGLISALKAVETKDTKNLLRERCGGLVIAEEFMTFLNKRSYEAGLSQILIPMWDCNPQFEYQTLGRGIEKINDGFLSIAAAATPQSLRDAIPVNVIGEGLTSRMIMVYSNEEPEPCPWPEMTEMDRTIEGELVSYMQTLASLEGGPLTLDPAAKEFFIVEYTRFFKGSPLFSHPQARPYASRRHVHLLKVAIALMVAEKPQKTIQRDHIAGAKYLLEEGVDNNLIEVFNNVLTTDKGDLNRKVLQTILTSGKEGILRSAILKQFSHRLDSNELKNVLDTLVATHQVKCFTQKTGGGIIYRIRTPEDA